MITACVEAGAVDGVSGKPEATVDGLPATWESGIYEDLYGLALNSGQGNLHSFKLAN